MSSRGSRVDFVDVPHEPRLMDEVAYWDRRIGCFVEQHVPVVPLAYYKPSDPCLPVMHSVVEGVPGHTVSK
jgi:hypothetical protein